MKKIMFGLAAAIAMVAAADIESSNVVGYMNTDGAVGFNFVSPAFKDIASDTVSIQSIKLNENGAAFTDTIQVLDEGGSSVQVYFWTDADSSPTGKAGWLNEDMDGLAEQNLVAGQSVLIDVSNEGTQISNAGEVRTAATGLSMVGTAGFNFVGNGSPVEISIQGIKLDENGSAFTDTIQILDEGGSSVQVYFWTDADSSPTGEAGWLNEDMDGLVDVKLAPGQGVLVDTANDGVVITMPTAL